jgi:hypothetical protein
MAEQPMSAISAEQTPTGRAVDRAHDREVTGILTERVRARQSEVRQLSIGV